MSSLAPVGRPEDELLLCCSRTRRSPETADRITALLREGINWEHLLQAANAHGVAPLLYWHLDAVCPEAIPRDIYDHLRNHFRANGLRNLHLTGELLKLLNTFATHGILAVPYKGAALAASVYGNLALREFGDLDILVHRHDVPKARELMISTGYQPRYQLTRAQEASFLRSQREYAFTHNDGTIIVELHWGITERYFFPLDTERLWERLHRIPLGGDTVLSLSPEDLLLILCVHGCRHAWGRLGWICDVAELVRVHRDMSWEQVMSQASALGGERMLFLGLFLASDLLGVVLPEKMSQKIQADPTVKALAERTREQLFQETARPIGLLKGYEGAPAFHSLHLEVRERLVDRIRYCFHKAITPKEEDWDLLSLPKFLFPFYYVLRPIRLTGKYGPRILKRLL